MTLTRIFVLTQEHQSLVREITTPSLSAFITACLQTITIRSVSQASSKPRINGLLTETILQALIKLLPYHPSGFRPFIVQIRGLLAPLVAPTPSSLTELLGSEELRPVPWQSTSDLAQMLYAVLPQCAPKNTANEEWNRTVRTITTGIHRTADHIFRAVLEDKALYVRYSSAVENATTFGKVVFDDCKDELGLPGWRGIHAGSERMRGLLQLLRAHVASPTPLALSLPIESILSAISRLLSVWESVSMGTVTAVRLNPEISRDERENLLLTLPSIHASAVQVLRVLLSRMQETSMTFARGVLERLLWIFERTKDKMEIRSSTYEGVAPILNLIGPSISKSTIPALTSLLRAACNDILPFGDEARGTSNQGTNRTSKKSGDSMNNNADSYLKQSNRTEADSCKSSASYEAAAALLPLTLSKLLSQHLNSEIRGLIDRTAILIDHEETMLASVLHPPRAQRKSKNVSSIMPLLARAHPGAPSVEAILRPRMPVIQNKRSESDEVESDVDEDLLVDQYQSKLASEPTKTIPSFGQTQLRGLRNNDLSMQQEAPAPWTVKYQSPILPETSRVVETMKRGRDIPVNPDAESSKELQSEWNEESGNKRQRTDVPLPDSTVQKDELVQDKSGLFNSTEASATQDLPTMNTVSETRADIADDSDNDSDRSFEIPPIVLDLDTDDDEEEEDDEGDER